MEMMGYECLGVEKDFIEYGYGPGKVKARDCGHTG